MKTLIFIKDIGRRNVIPLLFLKLLKYLSTVTVIRITDIKNLKFVTFFFFFPLFTINITCAIYSTTGCIALTTDFLLLHAK